MGKRSEQNTVQHHPMIKAVEIGIICALLPLVLRDTVLLPTRVAYPLGFLLGCVACYFVPPRIGLTFRIWLLVSALFAALLFIYEILVS